MKTTEKLENTYHFYGFENASPEILELYDDLKHAWSAETCSPKLRKDWTENNPSLGQCTITSFLVQDLFGGEVYGLPLDGGGVHCYNIIDNTVIDLASEQFGDVVLHYEEGREQLREDQLSDPDKRARYELLKKAYKKIRPDKIS